MKNFLLLFLLLCGLTATAQQQSSPVPVVKKPVYFDVSPPLRDMTELARIKVDLSWKDGVVMNHFNNRVIPAQDAQPVDFTDPGLQDANGRLMSDTTIANFEGLGGGAYIPPDTHGDVGPDHYFQVVNASFAIYNKGGAKVYGPAPNSSIWNGMPNNANSGDAVALYDETAHRWLFSQFSLPNSMSGPFFIMIAVSQTPDPTGSWYRYQYEFSYMPDYPKFGIWPDGYYMSCNRFTAGSGYIGTGAAAFERTLMLAGDPDAQMVLFNLPSNNEAYSMLPSDCDGTFPPDGTPNYFTYEYNGSPSHLGILEFQVDWTTPSNSTFGNLVSLPVNTFNPDLGPGISQKGTNVKLGTLSDRLMYRLQFRNFGSHWSMVCNHSVNAGSNIAGIRWYELRKTTGSWTVYQQATYAPADNLSRWMGSMAMDTAGNIAIGYSVSGNDLFPSIRYTGRMNGDPLNQMTIAEKGIINGGGCQTSNTHRWGDYSSLVVDPSAPTTFWYTTEYYSMTSSSNWQTRVASFTFDNVFSSYATSNPVLVCSGDSSQLASIAYGGSGTYTYSWTSIPAGFTSSLANPVAAPTDTTQYIVAVSDGNETHYDTTRVKVILPPVAFAGNDTTVCSYLPSIDLSGTVAHYKVFGWTSEGDGHFSDQFIANPTYTFGPNDYLAGSVDLELIAFALSPCYGKVTSTRHITLDPCTGIPETPKGDLTLLMQPNPARESVKITITGPLDKPAVMTLTNAAGQTVLTKDMPAAASASSIQVDVKGYPKGVYFIRLKMEDKVIAGKLVVY